MAYPALLSLEQTTDMILKHDKYSISVDEKEKINSIREYAIFLLSFLDDLREKAIRLEGKIRDAANETEDIIENFMLKQLHSSYKCIGPSRVEFKHQLIKATEQIGLIVGEIMEDRPGELPATISSSRNENDIVIGLDDDVTAIKDRLCGESSKLEVIQIIGMGGIGKTTLARNAYDDSLIMEHFHIRVWVSVSQHYDLEGLLRALLDSMKSLDENICGQKNETTAEKVYKRLKGRRYLIVMDDIWSTEVLDDVRNIFPNDNNRSRIMLTTRLSEVAAYADSAGGPVHEMKFMNGDQSWNLLKQKVLTNDQYCPPELEDIGKAIALGCRGLPLAVVLVAGIMSTIPKTRASWEKIAKNVNSVVDGQLDKILSLSYTHLPHHLRPCFLIMGGFPEDHNIHVWRLIKFWVAEGFLKRQNEYKSLEERAEEYLEDLIKRSLVLITSRKSNGKIKSCSLHDLVRDMCIRKAQEEKFLVHVMDRYEPPQSIIKQRRFSITHTSHLDNICGPTIHTILCFQLQKPSLLAYLGTFRLLRVLDVVNYSNVLLPSQVFDLFHLRYLALRNPVYIPSAISNLENLQTLIICTRIQGYLSFYSSLPSEIWRMAQLRHLVFFKYYALPDPTHPLHNLQTLSYVASLVCSEKNLKMIPNVKKLGLLYNDGVYREYQLHNLVHLHQLEKLKVIMDWKSSWLEHNPGFPWMLKKLTLYGGRFPMKYMSIVGSLPNLEVVKLRNMVYSNDELETWETDDGEFPQLKFLLIEKSNWRDWITESSHFPRLKCLVLRQCLSLNKIPVSIGDIPTLELIELDYMNKHLVDSAKQIQEDQKSYGNDALQIRCHNTYFYQD